MNLLLVKEGYAEAYSYKPDVKYCNKLEDAEKSAKSARIGIWSGTNSTTIGGVNFTYVCSSNIYDCGSFSTHAEAQKVFEACGGMNNDVHKLDGDKDGFACETPP